MSRTSIIEIHAEDDVYQLTPEPLKLGLKHMAQNLPSDFRDIVDFQGDASTADVFLQCCLFKDVVMAETFTVTGSYGDLRADAKTGDVLTSSAKMGLPAR